MTARLKTPATVTAAALLRAVALAGMIAAGAAPAARAQGSARAWGLAGAYTAAARGLDAVDWNPANLAFSAPSSFSLEIASLAADVRNNSFTLERYNEVSGATLSEADKERLLDDIPENGFTLRADARAGAAGCQSGPVALTLQGIGAASGRAAKDFFDLVLMGNPVDRAFSFAGTDGEGYAVVAATLSAAAPLAAGDRVRLCAGANLRYLRGIWEMHVEEADGTFVTAIDHIAGEASATILSATGGAGYALDIGFAVQAPRGWTFGLALDNACSRVDWNRGTERRVWSAVADSLDATQEDLDARVVQDDTTFATTPYHTTLPRRLRLGASNEWGPLLLALDVAQGLEDRAGVTTRTELSAGAEWRLCGWLRPRAGVALGGGMGASGAAGVGLGLGPWRLDLAAINRGQLWPTNLKGLALAMGSRLEF